ncbi:MAG TPA: NAD(P)/FAD-dependent oxidoreductase [Nitrospira sp.]|nr:NAD(P)/FAD-dependent oxidoreductase [Nitrospira sp.]
MMDRPADLAIVGAGAAGLATAIFAAEQDRRRRIVLLDGAKTLGAKILISGGGRCNVTHYLVTVTDFFGNRRIIKNVLAAFSVEQTIRWFASLGVILKKEETGKLFPTTDKARTVLDALVNRCRALGVELYPAHRVTAIERFEAPEARFILRYDHGQLQSGKVVLATGGRSLPKSGSDGSGYALAKRLGHSIMGTVPALVPLVLEDTMFHRTLSGLSQEVELTTVVAGKLIDSRKGSLLWTHFGISGPVVMDVSRFWTLAREHGDKAEVYADFLPDHNPERLKLWFTEETRRYPRRSLVNTLACIVPERFGEALCRHVECDPRRAIAQVPRHERDRLIVALTKFPLPITMERGWNYAEVTAGGVPLEEVDFRTMESKLVPGLYLVGEILDCDGRIGGFNFQWAWATGNLAGRSAFTNPSPS